MPQLEQLILAAPQGFVNTLLKLNEIAKEEENNDRIDSIVSSAWEQMETGTMTTSHEVRAVNYIIRSMKQAQPPCGLAQTATILASNTVLSQECIEKILLKVKALSTAGQVETFQRQVACGKVSNVKWRIGTAISSSVCRNIFSPYITLSFDVTDSQGKPSPVVLELSYDQFKDLRSTFEKVAKVMDSI